MKQLITTLVILLSLSLTTKAQTTADSLLVKAGKQGKASVIVPMVTAIIFTPIALTPQTPETQAMVAVLMGISLIISVGLRISSYNCIQKAGLQGFPDKGQKSKKPLK
jgi:hypothetical protein